MEKNIRLETQKEFEKITGWQLWVLRLMGCGAYEPNFRISFATLVILFLAGAFVVITIFDLFLFQNDVFNFTFALVTLSYAVIGCTRLGFIIFHPNPYSAAFQEAKQTYLLASSDERDQQVLQHYTKLLKQCISMYSIAFLGGSVGTAFLPLIVYLWNGEKILPFGVVIPFTDLETSLGYQLNYMYQVSCILWTPPGLTASQNIYITLVFNICIQYDLIFIKLDELDQLAVRNIDGTLDKEVEQKFIEIIKYQQRLNQFVAEVENRFTVQIFVEISCNALQIVVTLFVMEIDTWIPGYLVITVATFQSFLYCILGTLIDMKTELFTEKIYNVAWHRMRTSEQNNIKYMLSKSQQSVLLTNGGMLPMNMNLFLAVYKKSIPSS
ncbi:putative odorant receptor 83c [Culex quinquefasciatus]|uniref:putative odorant receptor 83c n=1 Tax=Culex quinquefasciatus TaxID=7176 RepID=UPI0018E39F69|nr:putative odorant receptor 83c [Culex quinquefasciatus]